ncbi:hypothetical protein HGRIS_001200 [Hohenbuehelia grisea]|uniref:Uncharacterized protein n=1 Tax=Hohenbuehelia grisea TaxID=104357 RepID=A0ABR3JP58_9AGAR
MLMRVFHSSLVSIQQMPNFISGYFVTFVTARAIMQRLEIDAAYCNDHHLPGRINNWLADGGMTNVLAGTVPSPNGDSHGLLVVTHAFIIQNDEPSHSEDESDKKVKQWLQGDNPNQHDVQWFSGVDTWGVTLGGFQPRKSQIDWEDGEMSLEDLLLRIEKRGNAYTSDPQ